MIDLKPDGSFRLNMDCFGFLKGSKMTNRRFEQLLGGPPRDPESPFEQRHMDVAASVQEVVSEAMLRLARQASRGDRRTPALPRRRRGAQLRGQRQIAARQVCSTRFGYSRPPGTPAARLARRLRRGINLKTPSRKGRAGLAWPGAGVDSMRGSLLGPEFSEAEIRQALEAHGAVFEQVDEAAMLERAAELLANGAVLGWFQGRMEFGPRALGSRSILGDARLAFDAVGHQPKGQVPRVIPAVRTGGAGGAGGRIFRPHCRVAVHAAG